MTNNARFVANLAPEMTARTPETTKNKPFSHSGVTAVQKAAGVPDSD
jgi:hypothetical protein